MAFSLFGLASQSAAGLAAELPSLPARTLSPQPVESGQVPPATPPASGEAADIAADVDDQTEEQVAYPSLAAAVADQSVPGRTDEELRCLAGAIYFESRGEPLPGQLAVAQVVLNRAASRRFGGSLCDVVTQKGQFSFVRGGRVPQAPGNRDWNTAVAVAKVALKNAWESDVSDALYFNTRRGGHAALERVAAIGNHVFYR